MSSKLLRMRFLFSSSHQHHHQHHPKHRSKILHHEFVPSSSKTHDQHLIILHGIMGYGKLYKHLATNQKTEPHFNSYLLDFRNHGQSFWAEEMGVEDMARDVKKWMDDKNLPKGSVTLVGHSLGGRVAVSLTEQFPQLAEQIKKVVIVDAAAHSYEGFPFIAKSLEFFDKLAKVDFTKTDAEILSYIKSICVNDIQESMIRLNLDLSNRRFVYNLDAIIKEYWKATTFNVDSVQWDGDVYVLKALKSHYINDHSKQHFKKLYKGLKRITDVDCYHNIHLQKPYEIIKLLHV